MREILKSELIGLEIVVTTSKNKINEGLSGTIVDETKNTITLLTKNTEKKLLKDQIKITATINGKKTTIDCSKLISRPEERIKKSR